MKTVVFLATILLSISLWGDEFNNYRWNRKNHLAGNSKVDTTPWFEWWYYKVVIPEKNRSFYFVYGVVNPWDYFSTSQASRAVLSMGDFERKIIFEDVLPVSKFHARYDEAYARVDESVGTDKRFYGSVLKDGELAKWDVNIKHEWTFNATGWVTGKGVTNIEWYPAQASATCSGTIQSGEESIEFENAPCYQDRNWGDSFPKWWTWIVSNHFEESPGTALAIGGGWPKIKGVYTPVKGVAIGLLYKGKEYTFRPNDLDRTGQEINFGTWKAWGAKSNIRIEIEASAPKESFMDLQFMTPSGKLFHDYETLSGEIVLKIYNRQKGHWVMIENLRSNWGGIEYGSENIYDLIETFFNQSVRFH